MSFRIVFLIFYASHERYILFWSGVQGLATGKHKKFNLAFFRPFVWNVFVLIPYVN